MDWAAHARSALQKAGLTTTDLANDDKVREAAQLALKLMPFPARMAAKAVGFEKLVFLARDKALGRRS